MSIRTQKLNKPKLEKLYWKDVRDDVAKVNPAFASIVDELDPGKDFPLYLAHYPYGSVIVDEGKFYLPTADGALASMDSLKIPQSIKDDFEYSGVNIPAGIVLDKSIELSIKYETNVLPWLFYKAANLAFFNRQNR